MFELLARRFCTTTTTTGSPLNIPTTFSGIEDDSLNILNGPLPSFNNYSISFKKEGKDFSSIVQIEPQNQLLQIVFENKELFVYSSFSPSPNDFLFIKKINSSFIEFCLSSKIRNPSFAYHYRTPKRTISTHIDDDGEISLSYIGRNINKGIIFDWGGDLFYKLNSFNASCSLGFKAQKEDKIFSFLINPLLTTMRFSATIADKITASVDMDPLSKSINDVEFAFMNFKNFHLASSLRKGLIISYSAIYKGISLSFKIPLIGPFHERKANMVDNFKDESYQSGIHINISL